MSLIDKVYTRKDMRAAAKCLFACEVDLKHDNRDIAKMLLQAADMVDRADDEAAAKRERETTSEKSSAVGNAAAMREALLRCDAIAQLPEIREYVIVKDMRNLIKKALAAPPRNCDVGTADEQQDRFREFCRKHFDARECGLGKSVAKCPAYRGDKIPDCSLWWAQMPYEEGDAE